MHKSYATNAYISIDNQMVYNDDRWHYLLHTTLTTARCSRRMRARLCNFFTGQSRNRLSPGYPDAMRWQHFLAPHNVAEITQPNKKKHRCNRSTIRNIEKAHTIFYCIIYNIIISHIIRQVKNIYFIFRKLALQIFSANIVRSLSKSLTLTKSLCL